MTQTKEEIKAANKRWMDANKEKTKADSKKWRDANREKVRENSRKWRDENREKVRASNKKWRDNNKEKTREIQRRWQENNPIKVAQYGKKWADAHKEEIHWYNKGHYNKDEDKNRHLIVRYGITLIEYNKMFETQGGRCYLCDRAFPILCVDHDHVSKKVRALLCHDCNTGLGKFQDNPDVLLKAAEYLKKEAIA